jgi:hypothetical protein
MNVEDLAASRWKPIRQARARDRERLLLALEEDEGADNLDELRAALRGDSG